MRLFRRWKRRRQWTASTLDRLTPNSGTHILCYMDLTLSVDEQTVERARRRAKTLGKSLEQLIRDYLLKLAGGDDAERSIEEFERLSGGGNSNGWKFDRDEIHERS
jgi:Family of unknown function (DUF6364)